MPHTELYAKQITQPATDKAAMGASDLKTYHQKEGYEVKKGGEADSVSIHLYKDYSYNNGDEINETFGFVGEQQRAKHALSQTYSDQTKTLSAYASENNLSSDHLVAVTTREQYESTSLYKRTPSHLMDIGSSSVLLLLAVWNIQIKIDEMAKEKREENKISNDKKVELGEAFVSTSYLIENVARSLSDQKHVDDWYQAQSEIIKDGMTLSSEQGFSFTPLSFLATIGSSISVGLSLRSLYLDFKEHTPSLIAAHFTQLNINMGTTISFIGSAAEKALADKISEKVVYYASKELYKDLSEAALKKIALSEVLEATSWGFARKGLIRFAMPFASGYVGMFLIVSGIAVDLWLTLSAESELKKWAKSTPFNLDKSQYVSKDEGELLAEFANIMTRPSAVIGKMQDSNEAIRYFIDFTLPMFDLEHHKLQLCIYSQDIKIVMGQQYGSFIPISKTHIEYGPSQFHMPLSQECIFDEKLQLTKVRIHLEANNNWLHKRGEEAKLSCQFRIILNDGISLPLEKYHENYLHLHQIRGADEAYAYHAEPIVIVGQGNNAPPKHTQDDNSLPNFLEKHSTNVKVNLAADTLV